MSLSTVRYKKLQQLRTAIKRAQRLYDSLLKKVIELKDAEALKNARQKIK